MTRFFQVQLLCESKGQKGFTLIELMITLIISTVIVGAIYSAYLTNQRVQTAQDQVVEMQQNLRAGMNMIVRELRMAGFDPTQSADAGINDTNTNQGRISFTMDLNENGDVTSGATNPNENIIFGFPAADDTTNDGIADAGAASFGRSSNGGGFQAIADNIVAVEFLYHLDNGSKDPTTFSYTRNPSAGEIDDIRAVTISLLARAANPDQHFTSTQNVTPASARTISPAGNTGDDAGWVSSGASWSVANNYRRRLLVTTVKLRNLGL